MCSRTRRTTGRSGRSTGASAESLPCAAGRGASNPYCRPVRSRDLRVEQGLLEAGKQRLWAGPIAGTRQVNVRSEQGATRGRAVAEEPCAQTTLAGQGTAVGQMTLAPHSLRDATRCVPCRAGVRRSPAYRREIIELVEHSALPVGRTLAEVRAPHPRRGLGTDSGEAGKALSVPSVPRTGPSRDWARPAPEGLESGRRCTVPSKPGRALGRPTAPRTFSPGPPARCCRGPRVWRERG